MSLTDVKLHLVDDLDTANELMRWLGERRVGDVAFDTETTGLSPENDKVRLLQLGDEMHGWAIPWVRWGGVFFEAVKRYEGRLTGHNTPFDVAMIRSTCNEQMPIDRLDDTRRMAHVIQPNRSTALKSLGVQLVDPMAAALQDQLQTGTWTWGTVPIEYGPYWQYAAFDTVLTARIKNVIEPMVKSMGAWRAYELELASAWVCERMERNGINVDREYAALTFQQFTDHANALSEWCKTHYDVRPSQNASVAARLIEDGIVLDKKTESGAVAVDREVLGGVTHPLAEVVLEHRRYSKLASTYLRNFVKLTSDEDPRLHPRINSIGAVTSRMTMDTPNLQNLPRRSEANPAAITVRDSLTAGEGRTLLMVDYDQIELRFLAHISNDPGLRAAFMDPDTDVFTAIARDLFVDLSISKKDERRQHTKNAMYAIGYGAGARKFARTAGISDESGQMMYDMIAARYPLMKGLNRHVENRAYQRQATEGLAYARSPLTGRIHPIDQDRTYTIVNKLVQGTAAELLKMKLVELDLAGYGDMLVLPVHDEIVLDVPTEDVREIARDVTKIMADDDLISVPITVAPSAGFRWGSKEDLIL